jgi:hypothetical protein
MRPLLAKSELTEAQTRTSVPFRDAAISHHKRGSSARRLDAQEGQP